MSKYAYAYFGSDGQLKEFILDPSVRQGNQGINQIYVYWENPVDCDYVAQTYINTDLQDAEWSTPEVIEETGEEFFYVPVIQDYDPKYFKYGKKYENTETSKVLLLTIPSGALTDNANIALSLLAFEDQDDDGEYDENDNQVMYLGIITFHVKGTGASFPVTIDKSQFYLLLSRLDDSYTKLESDAKYVNLTGEQTILGAKIFTNRVTVQDPVNNKEAANKDYVDSKITEAQLEPGISLDSVPTSGSNNAVKSGGVYSALAAKENNSNKTNSISSSSTIVQYPSAKAVYNSLMKEHVIMLNDTHKTIFKLYSPIVSRQDGSALSLAQFLMNHLGTLIIDYYETAVSHKFRYKVLSFLNPVDDVLSSEITLYVIGYTGIQQQLTFNLETAGVYSYDILTIL